MPQPTNKIFQFWQELKRRRVVRVIIVYAAASFVILELVSIIVEPLKLPEWLLPVVIVLLCIGFIMAVILSWIYDIKPEGGIVKTESAQEVIEEGKPASSNSWKIASYVSFVVILALIILNIIPRSSLFNVRGSLDRSIAVIPFRNDSPEEEKMGFINGTMEQILDNLSQIEGLRVVSRTSVEQYRDAVKTISVIAKEMDVGYILEGSGQRDGNNVRITVQLLDANEDTHIWADTHIRETEDVFDLQREVARLVVEDLETLLSQENDQTSEELPPNILIAEAFFQRGLKEMSKYWNMPNRETQEKAEDLFRYSLEYDSTLIPSYKQLAQIYQNKYADQIDYKEDALDSVLVIAEKSLLLDPSDSRMLRLKSWVFRSRGENELARDALEQAIIYDPELQNNYIRLARLYMDMDNIPKALETFFKVLDLNSESVTILKRLSAQFKDYGLKDLSLQYLEEAFRLDRDTIYYYNRRGRIEWAFGDFDSAIVYQLKAVEMDSLNSSNLSILAICYLFNHQYELSMIYFKKHMERAEALNQRWVLPRYIGFVWIQNGQITEGERILNEIYITYQERLQLGIETKDSHRILGAIHAIRGEKEKAIEHLRSFALTTGIESFDLQTLENSPLYDNIRDEPEFQNIFKEVQDLVQRKHDQMRQWLEENDRL